MMSDQLKRLRKSRGMTQIQLADALNVSQATIASWENGSRMPSHEMLPIIADLFSVSIDELYGTSLPNTDAVDAEVRAIRDRVRTDPAYRLLFDAASRATPDNVRAAAAMLKALEENQPK